MGMNKRTLGEAVKTARHELGISQRELAALVGVEGSHIAYIEGNRRKPSLSVLVRLAGALGLKRRELLLLSRPEAKVIVDELRDHRPRPPHDAWRRFACNQVLHRRHRIRPAELRVLKQIGLNHEISSSAHFLFILNAIRQAGVPPD
jgi:transcriptional regulator with XRE-family HTH domain